MSSFTFRYEITAGYIWVWGAIYDQYACRTTNFVNRKKKQQFRLIALSIVLV